VLSFTSFWYCHMGLVAVVLELKQNICTWQMTPQGWRSTVYGLSEKIGPRRFATNHHWPPESHSTPTSWQYRSLTVERCIAIALPIHLAHAYRASMPPLWGLNWRLRTTPTPSKCPSAWSVKKNASSSAWFRPGYCAENAPDHNTTLCVFFSLGS